MNPFRVQALACPLVDRPRSVQSKLKLELQTRDVPARSGVDSTRRLKILRPRPSLDCCRPTMPHATSASAARKAGHDAIRLCFGELCQEELITSFHFRVDPYAAVAQA
jgi:hypothetical protein